MLGHLGVLVRALLETGALSYRRLDVLVESEQVRRIVCILQRHQPFVVATIGRPDPRGCPGVQVVDVHPTRCERLHRGPELTGSTGYDGAPPWDPATAR